MIKTGQVSMNKQLTVLSPPRRNPGRHHRHGPPHIRHLQRVRGRLLHAVRGAVLRGVHGRHPAVLHLPGAVAVHPLRVGQRPREAARRDGGRLDRAHRLGVLLVLPGLRTAAHIRGDPVAG